MPKKTKQFPKQLYVVFDEYDDDQMNAYVELKGAVDLDIPKRRVAVYILKDEGEISADIDITVKGR